jgi:hypothetical protein
MDDPRDRVLLVANIASVTIEDSDFGRVVITAHNKSVLADDEWESGYLAYIRHLRDTGAFDRIANLVFAEGCGPSSKQRSMGNSIFGKNESYQFKVAVVTDALMVRGVVTAIRWFNPLIDAFGPVDWARALEHARLAPNHWPVVQDALHQLVAKVPHAMILKTVTASLEDQLAAMGAGASHSLVP